MLLICLSHTSSSFFRSTTVELTAEPTISAISNAPKHTVSWLAGSRFQLKVTRLSREPRVRRHATIDPPAAGPMPGDHRGQGGTHGTGAPHAAYPFDPANVPS